MSETKYQYQRRLGGGGMAEVFLASTVGAEGFTRPVAIKRVLPSFSSDGHFSTMFVNEARLSALLIHPNIVQTLDFDRDGEGRLYLVMELVAGKDLSELAERGPLPVPVVVYIIVEALKGLAHAHEMTTAEGKPLGIVHRDISPHNVLVSWDGAVKVSDFGIAKAMLASGAGQSGMIKGKPMYMAPEQVTSPDTLDQRADLFAVGVMLYELLTGRRLYQGNTNEEVLTDIIQVAKGWRQMTAPNLLRADLPWDVSQTTMMLLAPDRAHRFATARDAIDALLATSSASARAGEELVQLMAERFPGEAPPRVTRRAGAPGLVAGPGHATWVVTPPPTAAAGTPTPSIQQVMSAETRTVTPSAQAAAAPVQAATFVATAAPRRRSIVPFMVGGVAVIAAAAAVALLAFGGDDRAATTKTPAAGAPAATTADAAPAQPAVSPDAGAATPAPVDAAVAPIDATIAPIDASPRRPGGREGKKPGGGTGNGSGTSSSTIHEIQIPDGD